ncbi:hypothetical protein GOODEAATRI_019031, partial [Goodea atripinnis]
AKLEQYRTAPFDARFPNQNQTRNCWSNYLATHLFSSDLNSLKGSMRWRTVGEVRQKSP